MRNNLRRLIGSMRIWIILLRESDHRKRAKVLAQLLSILEISGLFEPGDRIIVYLELESSFRVIWAQRAFHHWLSTQSLHGCHILTAHPTRLTRQPDEWLDVAEWIFGQGGNWWTKGVNGRPYEFVNPLHDENAQIELERAYPECKWTTEHERHCRYKAYSSHAPFHNPIIMRLS